MIVEGKNKTTPTSGLPPDSPRPNLKTTTTGLAGGLWLDEDKAKIGGQLSIMFVRARPPSGLASPARSLGLADGLWLAG